MTLRNKILVIVAICFTFIPLAGRAQEIFGFTNAGIIDFVYNRVYNLLYSNPNINTVLIGATATTTNDVSLEVIGGLQVDNATSTGSIYAGGEVWGDAQNMTLARIGNSTFSTVQDLQNVFHSAGWVSGGVISDAGGGNIDVAAGTGLIRDTNSSTATMSYFDWTASSTIDMVNEVNYIGVEYNAGSPRVAVRTSYDWDFRTDFPLGTVINLSGILHLDNTPFAVGDHASTMIQRLHGVNGCQRDNRIGGLILGETGTRNVTMTAGTVWCQLVKHPISAIDTSGADTFATWYYNGSAWVKTTGVTQYPNTQYNNIATGLANLTPNQYVNLWFYLENDNDLEMVYGQTAYNTLAQAEVAAPPSFIPEKISVQTILIGRIIVQQGDSSATEINTVFDTTFNNTGASDHGNLAGLTDDDHTQYALLADTRGEQTFAGGIVLGNASTTGSLAVGSLSSGECVQTGAGGLLTTTGAACGTGSGGGGAAWEYNGFALTPTSSSAGIYVNASSTINSNFRVAGNATTTGSFSAMNNELFVTDGSFVINQTSINTTSDKNTIDLVPTTFQEDYLSGTDQTISTKYFATQITASFSDTVRSLSTQLKRTGTITNTSATIQFEVWSDSAGQPGTLLSTSTGHTFNELTTGYQNFNFATAPLPTLASGTDYWLVIKLSAVPAGGTLQIRGQATGTNENATSSDGSSWTTGSGFKGRFQMFARTGRGLIVTTKNSDVFYGVSETGSIYTGFSSANSVAEFDSYTGNTIVTNSDASSALFGTTISGSGARLVASGSGIGATITSNTGDALQIQTSSASADAIQASGQLRLTANSNNDNIILQEYTGGQYWNVGVESDGSLNLLQNSQTFPTNNVLTLKTSGSIGVATTTPGGYFGEILTVVGDSYIQGSATTTNHFEADGSFYVKDLNIGLGEDEPLGITVPSGFNSHNDFNRFAVIRGTTTGGDEGIFLRRSDDATGLDLWAESGGSGDAYIDSRFTGSSGGINFRVGTNSTPVNAMRIENITGNIGVGTTTPDFLLSVVGKTSNQFEVVDSNGNAIFEVSGEPSAPSGFVRMGDIDGADNGQVFNVEYSAGRAYFDGLNLGVSTSTPTYLITIDNETGTSNGLFVAYNGADASRIGSNASGGFISTYNSSGSQTYLMRGYASGGVQGYMTEGAFGIATTTPSGTYGEELTVVGNSYFESSALTNRATIDVNTRTIDGTGYGVRSIIDSTSPDTNLAYAGYFESSGTNINDSNYGIYTTASNAANENWALYSAAGDNYFAGDIGVGTLTPDAPIHIALDDSSLPSINSGTTGLIVANTSATSDSSAISIISGVSGYSSVNFGDPGDEDIGEIEYWHQGDTMFVSTAGTRQVTIDGDGEVGIGAAVPDDMLDISGNDSGEVSIEINNSNTSGDASIIFNLNAGNDFTLGAENANNEFVISNGTDTTDPIARFQNGGNIIFDDDLYIGHDSGTDDDYLYYDAGSEYIRWNNTTGNFEITDELTPITANGATLGSASAEWQDLYFTPPSTATCRPFLMLNTDNRVYQLSSTGVNHTYTNFGSEQWTFSCGALTNVVSP